MQSDSHACRPCPLLPPPQFRPLTWRVQHPYLVADRFEDITPAEAVRQDPLCDRRIALFGYLRGCNLKPGMRVHLAGVGDFDMAEVSSLPDPCPLPGALKRRSLDERERLLYAPMSDVGRLLYDKDAMYVNIADHTVNFTRPEASEDAPQLSVPVETPGVQMVRGLQDAQLTLNEKLARANIRLFGSARDEQCTDDADMEDADSSKEAWSDESDEDEEQAPGTVAAQAAHRVRRPVEFGGNDDASDSDGEDEAGSDGTESDYDELDSDAEGLGAAARWKKGIGQHAAQLHDNLDLMVRGRGACMVPAHCSQRHCNADGRVRHARRRRRSRVRRRRCGGRGRRGRRRAVSPEAYCLRWRCLRG